ncbi:MAG: hypothetical protein ACTSSJ_07750, partial [Candidatus Odinarchaeia archaeon]
MAFCCCNSISSSDAPNQEYDNWIGYFYSGGAGYFKGLIDNVLIFDRELSENEILALYHDGLLDFGYVDGNNFIVSDGFGYDFEQDITDFSSSTYKYCVVSATRTEINVLLTLGIVYTDASEENFTVNFQTNQLLELTTGKTVDKIKIYVESTGYTDVTASLSFITFSVQEINIESATVNYENTYLSPNQTITISSITAKWADGTAIDPANFKVNLIENSTVISSNVSAPITRTV